MSGTADNPAGGTAIRPFTIPTVADAELDELRARIAATRWPERELVADRSQGVQLTTIQELARYWTTNYDWRKCEARLNALAQFKTEIDGVDVHFIHVKSQHEDALPLIITHGWPGSVIELLGVIGPLTDPTSHGASASDAFHLVVPSMPGYGFSGAPTEVGWDPGRIAQAWAELMRRLGYTSYVAQGGDQGAWVTDQMGRQAPEGLIGIHMNLLVTTDGATLPTETEAGTRGGRRAQHLQDQRLRLLPGAGHAAADDRLRPAGFTPRPGGLDARPRHRLLLQDLPCLHQRAAVRWTDPGPHPGQHHGVLADRHRDLGGPVVLGARTSPGPRGRADSPVGQDPSRLHGLPRRVLPRPAQLGRAGLPHPQLLPRG